MGIHEQNYVRYDGPIREGRAWWTIAWTGFRTYVRFVRTMLMLLFLWIGPLVVIGLIFVEYWARGQLGQIVGGAEAPDGARIVLVLQMQFFSLALLYMITGCGVISEDLRYRTFQLYFSKPLSRIDYAVGKFASLFMLGSLVTIVPGALLSGLRAALFLRSDFFKPVLEQMAIGMAMSILITIVLAAIVVGLSSLTARTGQVVLAWIGVVLVPFILGIIVTIATDGQDIAHLWSLNGNFYVVCSQLLTEQEFSIPRWASPAILVVAAVAGIGAMMRRISKLEGIA